jgi:hypothetical protein
MLAYSWVLGEEAHARSAVCCPCLTIVTNAQFSRYQVCHYEAKDKAATAELQRRVRASKREEQREGAGAERAGDN